MPVPRRLLTVAIGLILLSPAGAAAQREPTPDEAQAIESAAMQRCQTDQDGCQWKGAKVSTEDPTYAYAIVFGDSFSSDAILHRSAPDASDWSVLIVQGGGIRACSEYTDLGIPKPVLADLEITGLAPGSTGASSPCGGPTAKRCKKYKGWQIDAFAISCTKARDLLRATTKRAPYRAPKGWSWVTTENCVLLIVPKADRVAANETAAIPKRGVQATPRSSCE